MSMDNKSGIILSTAAILICLIYATGPAEAGEYLLAEPKGPHRIDYLVVAGEDFADKLDELCNHRAKQGYRVGIVRMPDVTAEFESLRAFIRHAVTNWEPPAPRYLLLVGDVDTVPTVVGPGAMRGWMSCPDLATDFDYARPSGRQIELHVGRFPSRTPAELERMVRKTLDYEANLPGGGWQRRLKFVAGVGGYGEAIDRMLEGIAESMIATSVPPVFDIRAAHASPTSPFCPYPPRFNQYALEMFNRGSLLYMYVGHGSPTGVDDVRWLGRTYPVLRAADADKLAIRQGLPIMVVIACHTGAFDGDEDSLGERFVKAGGGPVAFIGGSRVTQPYANALFAEAFVGAFFGGPETLGEVLSNAKTSVIAHAFSLRRMQIDAMGGAVQGRENLPKMRQDVVRHYNLLGDPALVIRRPVLDIKLEVRDGELHVAAPHLETVELTLEYDRITHRRLFPEQTLDPAAIEEQMTERYRRAHDTLIRRWEIALNDGAGSTPFVAPEQPGRYILKAAGGSSSGVLVIDIPE